MTDSKTVSQAFGELCEGMKDKELAAVFMVGVMEDGSVVSAYHTSGQPLDILSLYAYAKRKMSKLETTMFTAMDRQTILDSKQDEEAE